MPSIAEPELAAFRAILQKHTGFNFPAGLDREFNFRLERALHNNGYSLKQVIHQLQAVSPPDTSSELLSALLPELLIGETYFWREPETFSGLTGYILPQIVERKKPFSQLLRVWSAGCSTGEEVYSLSILLRRFFSGSEWLVPLLGTDINEAALEVARRAEYGQYSFRNSQYESSLAGCFEPVTQSRLPRHKVKDEYRAGVRFQKLNLASLDYPSPSTDTCNYDLIFCRNVFIYFQPQLVEQIVERFYEALNDGGYLVVGACEYFAQYLRRFEAVQVGTVTFYRRPARFSISTSTPSPDQSRPLTFPPASVRVPVLPQPTHVDRPVSRKAIRPAANNLLHEAKEAFAANRQEKALELALMALAQNSLAADSYLLLVNLYQQKGQLEPAFEMARKFAYLEPHRLEGQFYLASLQQALGRSRRAGQAYRRLLSLLDQADRSQQFEYLPGLTAADLHQLALENLLILDADKPVQAEKIKWSN